MNEIKKRFVNAMITAEAGTAVHETVRSNPVVRGTNDDPTNAYVVKTNSGVLIFDYCNRGSVNTFHESGTTTATEADWVLVNSDLGLAMNDEIRAACDKAVATCVAQVVEVVDSTPGYCIPDNSTGKVALWDFVKGVVVVAEKTKKLTLRNLDEASTDKVSEVSDELLKCYNTMLASKHKSEHETSIFAGPQGETCVVLPERSGCGDCVYICLNLGGVGSHITAEYSSDGFTLPVSGIRSETMNADDADDADDADYVVDAVDSDDDMEEDTRIYRSFTGDAVPAHGARAVAV